MSLSIKPVKGARDFYPDDMRLQKYLFGVMRSVCERYGYEEYDAPILEPTDLYLSKGNEEIVREQTYTFRDRGDRSVTLRTEMTPSVSRMVAAKRQELAYPLRWYSIPQCWRYERMQRGRGREFYQLNVDIFGVEDISADLEMIIMADAILKAYGAKPKMYEIRVNSRKDLNQRIEKAGIKTSLAEVMRLIDKYEKLETTEFMAKLTAQVDSPKELMEYLAKGNAGKDLQDLISRAKTAGVTNIKFVPTIARGFDYYTDIVFEVFDVNPDNNRSMFGGGRYDGLVELFGADSLPAAGFAMGDITLRNFLETNGLLPKLLSETDVYVILMGDVFDAAQKPINELRNIGLNVAVDSTSRKADKQIKAAVKKGVRYALFIGDKELKSQRFTLKDLQTGQEQAQSLEEIGKIVNQSRI